MKQLLMLALFCTHMYGQHYLDYTVDQNIIEKLDTNSSLIAKKLKEVDKGTQKHGVWQFNWLPGYYVKYGLARIDGMEKMQEVIDRCNLTNIIVADKRVYQIKNSSQKPSNRNCAIIIKQVTAAKNPPPITLDEVQELCTIMYETGYISMTGPLAKKGPNYIRTQSGSFCLIDTESRYDHSQLLKGFIRFLQSHDFNKDLSKDALKYILQQTEQLIQGDPSKTIKELKACLKEQSGTPTWGYRSYIKKICKRLKENS